VQKGVFTLDSGAVITGVLSTDPTFFPYKLVRTSIPQQIVSQLQRALLMDPRNGLAPTEWIVLRALVQLQAISRVLEGLAPAQQNAAVQSLQVILSTETKRSMIPSLLTFISSGGNGRLAAASTSSVLSSDVAATVVNQVILQDWNCSTRVWAASTSRDDRVDFTAEFLDETKCACLSSNYVPPDAASLDQRFVTASETWEDFGGWYGYDWFSQDAWQYTSSRRLSGSKFYSGNTQKKKKFFFSLQNLNIYSVCRRTLAQPRATSVPQWTASNVDGCVLERHQRRRRETERQHPRRTNDAV